MCYHCKELWHPDQTCDTARVQRALRNQLISMGLAGLESSIGIGVGSSGAGRVGGGIGGGAAAGATPLGSFSSCSAGTCDGITRAPPEQLASSSSAGRMTATLHAAAAAAAASGHAPAAFAALNSCAGVNPGDLKNCPRCRTLIMKANDGSCNHMTCALCGTSSSCTFSST